MDSELLVQLADGASRVLPLSGSRLTLGRSPDNELAFPEDPVLSRRHLAFALEGASWFLEDLGSKNGTRLNGEPVSVKTLLRPGDQVVAGNVTLTYRVRGEKLKGPVVVLTDEQEAMDHTSVTSLDQLISQPRDLENALSTGSPLPGTSRVQALLEAGRQLAGHRPLSELFNLILDLSVSSVGASRGVLLLLENAELQVRAVKGEGFRISKTVRDQVLNHRRSLLVKDASLDEALRTSKSIALHRVKSLIAAPLQTQNSVLGLIYVDSPDIIRPFTQEDLALLTVMANIAAVRIEHARLLEVEQAERMLAKELEQASEIQRNLLPKSSPEAPGYDIAGRSIACRSVGGDYFDYIEMPNGKLGLIVGDVAGKGLPAALLVSSLQAKVQVLAEDSDDVAPMISRLNRAMASACPSNRFVTFFLCVLDPATGTVEYANAGHNPPHLLRRNGEREMLPSDGPPLGILKTFRYPAHKVQLEPGDMLVIYSDGVTEAVSPVDEEYGDDRLMALLESHRGESAQEVLSALFGSLNEFMGPRAPADDITVVTLRRTDP